MAVTLKLALVLFALLLPSTVYSRPHIRTARDAKIEDATPEVPKEASSAPIDASTAKPAADEVTKKDKEPVDTSSAKPALNNHEAGHASSTDKSTPLAAKPTETVSSEAKPTSAALESESTVASVKVTGASSSDASVKDAPTTSGAMASSTEAASVETNPSTPKSQ